MFIYEYAMVLVENTGYYFKRELEEFVMYHFLIFCVVTLKYMY